MVPLDPPRVPQTLPRLIPLSEADASRFSVNRWRRWLVVFSDSGPAATLTIAEFDAGRTQNRLLVAPGVVRARLLRGGRAAGWRNAVGLGRAFRFADCPVP